MKHLTKNDSFVLLHHCYDLFNDYKGKKKYIFLVNGNHNSIRPDEFKNKACIFLQRYLKDDFKIKKATLFFKSKNQNLKNF